MTLGPPFPLAWMSLRYPAAVSLKLRSGIRKFGWLKMLNVSQRNWTNFRSPTVNRLSMLRLMFCVPGASRMLRPELPGAKGMNPYWSFRQSVRLTQAALDVLRSRHSEFVHERQRFTRGRLRSLVEREGLEILRCTYANALLAPVAFAKFRICEPLLRSKPQSGVGPVNGWLNRALYAPLEWESRWIGSGRNFPIGQSLILLARKS